MKNRKANARNAAQGASRSRPLTRRAWLGTAVGGAALLVAGGWFTRRDRTPRANVTMYKDPACGCCGNWAQRMRDEGFAVDVRELSDVSRIKRTRGVPDRLYSCHTSEAGDYVFEGHVPPDLVDRVLRDRPAIAGLAVPGMPASSPGMETGPGRYEVISFTRDGATAVFAVRS